MFKNKGSVVYNHPKIDKAHNDHFNIKFSWMHVEWEQGNMFIANGGNFL